MTLLPYRYSIYGGTLQTDLELPDLPVCAAESPPDWTMVVSRDAAADSAGALVAEESLGGGVDVRLFRLADGLRFIYSDTGSFDVMDSGRLVVWRPANGVDERIACIDLLGRVLAAAIQMSGAVCLHGSAVGLRQGVVGFLGEKGRGKSTLAAALADAGARLAADDTLAIRPGPPAMCLPGIQRVRLRADAADHLLRMRDGVELQEAGGRFLFTLPARAGLIEPTRLEALYLLVPCDPDALTIARRERTDTVQAAAALLGHSKLGQLQGTPEAAQFLDRARLLVETVPVYALAYPRHLERIGGCVDQLLGWHP